MIPASPELSYLIRCPKEWAELLEQCESENLVPVLKMALEVLPESSVRDARLARIARGEGDVNGAKALLNKHTDCPLCKAYYFALLVAEGDEATLIRLVETWRPDWRVGAETIEYEAEYRAYLSLSAAALQLGRLPIAGEFTRLAMKPAQHIGGNIVPFLNHEQGMLEFKQGRLYNALSLFLNAMHGTLSGSALHNNAADYALTLSYITSSSADLPEWAEGLLQQARGEAPGFPVNAPALSAFACLVKVQDALWDFMRDFHANLPFLYQRKHRVMQQEHLKRIMALTDGAPVHHVAGFMAVCCRALAVAMTHNPEAPKILKEAFKGVTTVPIMVMLYHATLIQIYGYLPTSTQTGEVKSSMRLLSFQTEHLSTGEKVFFRDWMRQFAPVALHMLSEVLPEFSGATSDLIVVHDELALLQDEPVKAYPAKFMNKHILDILSGKPTPVDQRMQAKRHREALKHSGEWRVVYQSVIDRMRN